MADYLGISVYALLSHVQLLLLWHAASFDNLCLSFIDATVHMAATCGVLGWRAFAAS